MASLDTNGGVVVIEPGSSSSGSEECDCDGDAYHPGGGSMRGVGGSSGGGSDDDDDRRPKLILHFDARNTIFVADSITNITPEQALNAYLTGVLWGRERPSGADGDGGGWEWVSERPTLLSPESGATTYYKYLEAELVRRAEDRETLRLAVGDFTQTPIGRAFESHHASHLELLRWPHAAERSHERLTLAGRDGHRYHYILPAFYRAIERLERDGRRYAIVVRTYGLDCSNVLDSIRRTLAGHHPNFPELPRMNVRRTPGRILRRRRRGGDGGKDDEIVVQVLDRKARVIQSVSGERSIYEHFCGSVGVTGYVDDYDAWQSDGYSHRSAKPLWIDADDADHHHIFFDDNYRVGMKDSIVDVRLLRSGDGGEGPEAVSLSTRQAAAYAGVSLVQVDLLECIRNESYFYDRIVECERNRRDRRGGGGENSSGPEVCAGNPARHVRQSPLAQRT